MKAIHRFTLLVLCFLVIAGRPSNAQINDKKVKSVLEKVDTNKIRERIKYLSDDKLRGRLPGTPGYQMAVDYVINELKTLNIQPGGEEGYIQKVTLRKAATDTTQSSLVITRAGKEVPLRMGVDYMVAPDLQRKSAGAEGDIVYVKYGVRATHLGYDDYQGLDVKGKIVLISEGIPDNFPASERAHFNLVTTKCDIAAKAGAVGVIILAGGNEKVRMPGARRAYADGVYGYALPDGTAFSSRLNGNQSIGFLAYIRASLYDRDIKGYEYEFRVKGQAVSRWSELISENIIGLIPGKDAKLKNEYLVHTAHLDHVGVGTPVKGDSIYNGAHDNASGTACLLEIARLYKASSTKRSVLIIFVTSEEKGLLGSGYFASHPTVPKSSIVADVNTDMPTIIAPLLSIEPLGAKHSTLVQQVQHAASYLHLEVMDDHIPEQVRFVRSDQYSFIRQGIPALHVKYGLKTHDPNVDLAKVIETWTEKNYHKPSDEFRESEFNFGGAATYVRLNFLIGWQVANDAQRPRWNKGDFFGLTFGQ